MNLERKSITAAAFLLHTFALVVATQCKNSGFLQDTRLVCTVHTSVRFRFFIAQVCHTQKTMFIEKKSSEFAELSDCLFIFSDLYAAEIC